MHHASLSLTAKMCCTLRLHRPYSLRACSNSNGVSKLPLLSFSVAVAVGSDDVESGSFGEVAAACGEEDTVNMDATVNMG